MTLECKWNYRILTLGGRVERFQPILKLHLKKKIYHRGALLLETLEYYGEGVKGELDDFSQEKIDTPIRRLYNPTIRGIGLKGNVKYRIAYKQRAFPPISGIPYSILFIFLLRHGLEIRMDVPSINSWDCFALNLIKGSQ